MRTVPTLCASGAGIGISAIGLALARTDDASPSTKRKHHFRDSSPRPNDMTATATFTVQTVDTYATPHTFNSSPFSFSAPESLRSASDQSRRRTQSGNVRLALKRSMHSREEVSKLSDRPSTGMEGQDEARSTPLHLPPTWLRRLSTLSSSYDSSVPSSSRPGSAALSQSNGSVAFSNAGSTTPIFGSATPPPLAPNKLVKRTSSLRSTNSSQFQTSGSRLPIPTFRRPATSHQRSATMQEQLAGSAAEGDSATIDTHADRTLDVTWRNYFTPKVAADQVTQSIRRSSTGIPNPIKRVYPDRKYTPVLVSASDIAAPADVEVDHVISEDEAMVGEVTEVRVGPSFFLSPLPPLPAKSGGVKAVEEERVPRRSFSISDLLSAGPQLWKQPGQGKVRSSDSRLRRKGGRRVASAPQKTAMGGILSTESERPAKRRDLTDSKLLHRSTNPSPSSTDSQEQSQEIQLHLSSATSQAQSGSLLRTESSDAPSSSPISSQPSPVDNRPLTRSYVKSSSQLPIHPSATQSEIPSTVGSDSEYCDDSTDLGSDKVFDSIQTRTTRSSSGRRGPPIETIFDESPSEQEHAKSTMLKDLLRDTGANGTRSGYLHNTIEEEDGVGTPVRTIHSGKGFTSSPPMYHTSDKFMTSSPPQITHMLDRDMMGWDTPDDEAGWDADVKQHFRTGLVPRPELPDRNGPLRINLLPRSPGSSSMTTTPARNGIAGADKDARSSIFDWSEQQATPSDQSPPRPKTSGRTQVRDPDNRTSRNTGRRAASGLHARSHSVPVAPDVEGKRNHLVAHKFGTWGIGSKAVTEDWNEDFDFDEPVPALPLMPESEEKRVDSGHEMLVPKSIREQQENVVANIGLLREWGLLIEELKELRIRAVALGILGHGLHAQAWREVDAMIELADQETDEQTLDPRRSPASSPGFDYDAFDEPMTNFTEAGKPRRRSSTAPEEDLAEPNLPAGATKDRSQQRATPDFFAARPRKDSEAVARSVIEALQAKRSASDPTVVLKPVQMSKKVPFDTATLRHIVPYVNGLKRKVKDALRETEGLYSSPSRRDRPDEEPAFSSIFHDPPDSPSARRKARRSKAATDHVASAEDSLSEKGDDLAKHFQMMAVSDSTGLD